jgi:hypothetical protein
MVSEPRQCLFQFLLSLPMLYLPMMSSYAHLMYFMLMHTIEPSWMTGDQNPNSSTYDDDYLESNSPTNNDRPKLLADIEQVVNGMHKTDEIDGTMEKLEALFYGNDDGFDWADSKSHKQSSFSFDGNKSTHGDWKDLPSHETKNQLAYSLESVGDVEDSDVSEWTKDIDANESHGSHWDSKYSTMDQRVRSESFHEVHSTMRDYTRQESLELVKANPRPQAEKVKPKLNRSASTSTSPYKYQICLFIQMQLCRTTTLADWIKQRNNACLHFDSEEKQKRARPAFVIFRHIVNGLEHVHSKGIIHRDLKPAVSFDLDACYDLQHHVFVALTHVHGIEYICRRGWKLVHR